MALINCSECGKEISDKAASCPHCGAPAEKASIVAVVLSEEEQELKLIDEFAKREKQAAEERQQNEVDEKTAQTTESMGKILFSFVILFVIIVFGVVSFMTNEENQEAEEKKVALIKAELLNKKKFLAERTNVLKQITEDIKAKKYDYALTLCSKYTNVKDKDLSLLCNQINDEINKKTALEEKKAEEEIERLAAKEAAKQEAELKASMGTRAWKLHNKHPAWSTEECKGVAKGQYWIGMSTDMMVASLGRPNTAKPSDYGRGKQWQYCYTDGWFQCFYDKNDDGIIDSYN